MEREQNILEQPPEVESRGARVSGIIHSISEKLFGPDLPDELKTLGGRRSFLASRGYGPINDLGLPVANAGPISHRVRARMRQQARLAQNNPPPTI
jgi:hypothetical protein